MVHRKLADVGLGQTVNPPKKLFLHISLSDFSWTSKSKKKVPFLQSGKGRHTAQKGCSAAQDGP